MNPPYIVFDVGKITALKEEFEASMAYVKQQLPEVNWNSPPQIKTYFKTSLQITLPDVKINTFDGQRSLYEHDPEMFDLLSGIIQLFKLKSIYQNYILCILRHLDGDRLYLRSENSTWVMPNHRPLFTYDELWACVKHYSAELIPLVSSLNRP